MLLAVESGFEQSYQISVLVMNFHLIYRSAFVKEAFPGFRIKRVTGNASFDEVNVGIGRNGYFTVRIGSQRSAEIGQGKDSATLYGIGGIQMPFIDSQTATGIAQAYFDDFYTGLSGKTVCREKTDDIHCCLLQIT